MISHRPTQTYTDYFLRKQVIIIEKPVCVCPCGSVAIDNFLDNFGVAVSPASDLDKCRVIV